MRCLQTLQARELHRVRRFVGKVGRGRAGARAVDEAEGAVEAHVLDQLHRLLEVGVGLAGEADDEVGGERDVRAAPRAGAGRSSLYSIAV